MSRRRARIQVLITGILWGGLATWSHLSSENPIRTLIFAGISAVFLASALLIPPLAQWLHKGLAAILLAGVNALASIILGLVYIFIFTPIGWTLRLLGKTRTTFRPDPALESYWIRRQRKPMAPDQYRRMY